MASNTDFQDSKVLSIAIDQRELKNRVWGEIGYTPVGMLYRREGVGRAAAEGVAVDPHSNPSTSVV